MCKCCQSCFETCYWHLIEKRFCYDESIALYEEPKEEKNNNLLVADNSAFYDSVSVIAGRAIVTIDPLPEKPKPPIVQQPTKKLRWWESGDPYPSDDKRKKSFFDKKIDTPEKDKTKEVNKKLRKASYDFLMASQPERVKKRSVAKNKMLERAQTISTIDNEVQKRKQSLHERRLSRSLTLNLDSHAELPVIRQASMPKFYLDTPEENQLEKTSMFRTPSSALTSPVLPNKNLFDFDLRSVVQLEKEKMCHKAQIPLVHGDNERSTRLSHIREKLNPLKIIRQGSLTHLPHASHHM